MTTPMYLGEIADDRIRGALGSMIGIAVNVGVLLAYSAGPWVDRVAFAGVGGALPLLFGLIFIWMPESPYFLLMKGKSVEAEKSLTWLRGSNHVSEEVKRIEQSVEIDRQNAGTIKELVTVPGNRKVRIDSIKIAIRF